MKSPDKVNQQIRIAFPSSKLNAELNLHSSDLIGADDNMAVALIVPSFHLFGSGAPISLAERRDVVG